MREIKFRTWDNDNNEYFKEGRYRGGWRWFNVQSDGTFVSGVDDEIDEPCHKSRFILEQFTGLHDKNGVGQEIYDGDLIGTPNGIVCQVVYRELYGQWWTKFNNTSHKSQWDKPLFEVAGNSYLKVIGNIHEEKP